MMQVRPGKQAPDSQALQGLAGAQLALNSFLAELVGGLPKDWPRSLLLYSAPCFSPRQGRWVGLEECGNFEPLCITSGKALPSLGLRNLESLRPVFSHTCTFCLLQGLGYVRPLL